MGKGKITAQKRGACTIEAVSVQRGEKFVRVGKAKRAVRRGKRIGVTFEI
jgi:hypothetical protein